MKIWIDLAIADPTPKRGDIVQTNVGNPRERTCLVLRSRRSKSRPRRFHLWIERWWQIERATRIRLMRSAERNGGESAFCFHRYGPKKKRHLLYETR